MSIIKKLQAIQSELEVPKSQYNSFGKYHYRNAEDILAAAKPICIKHGCLLTVADELIQLGDRFYVKATAKLLTDDKDDPFHIETTAYAREELTKKGMDSAQVTGAASSYARKYALNGLFCIDDVKDADHGKPETKEEPKKATYETAKDVFDDELTPEDEEYINSQSAPVDTGSKSDIVRSECVSCGEQMTQGQQTISIKKYGKALCPKCQKEVK